jgi:hypothetical protein
MNLHHENPTPWYPLHEDVAPIIPAVTPGKVTVTTQYGTRSVTAPALAYGRCRVEFDAPRCGCALAVIDPLKGPQWWAAGDHGAVMVEIEAFPQR